MAAEHSDGSAWFRGEGGAAILMDLPLPHSIAVRVEAGQIQRVNEDGSAWEPSGAKAEVAASRPRATRKN